MTRPRTATLFLALILTVGLILRIAGVGLSDERALADAVRNCDRVIVKPSPYSIAGLQSTLEIPGREAVNDVLAQFQFSGERKPPCKCEGDIVFEFYKSQELVATVSYHHASHLRWWNGSWEGDAYLTEGARRNLPTWLKSRGYADADKLVPLKSRN